MSKLLLLYRRRYVFLKYRFLTYKFCSLNFLGRFIPCIKPMNYTKEQVLAEIQKCIKQHIENFNSNKKECKIQSGLFLLQSHDNKRYHLKYNLQYTIEYLFKYELISIPDLEFYLFLDCYPEDIKIRLELFTNFDVEDDLFLDNVKHFVKHIKKIKENAEKDILTTLRKYKN